MRSNLPDNENARPKAPRNDPTLQPGGKARSVEPFSDDVDAARCREIFRRTGCPTLFRSKPTLASRTDVRTVRNSADTETVCTTAAAPRTRAADGERHAQPCRLGNSDSETPTGILDVKYSRFTQLRTQPAGSRFQGEGQPLLVQFFPRGISEI